MKSSIDANSIHLVDGTAEFTYVLTDFLPAGSISVRGELKSPNIIVDSSVSTHSSTGFCLIYFDTVVRCIHIKDCYIFLKK